jgi:hypothetical protein
MRTGDTNYLYDFHDITMIISEVRPVLNGKTNRGQNPKETG